MGGSNVKLDQRNDLYDHPADGVKLALAGPTSNPWGDAALSSLPRHYRVWSSADGSEPK